jgi:release factor glutamine methyltransferase
MVNSLESMVRRRLAGEPLQYVMRRWAFRHLDVLVDERVLIPRPETEMLVDIALELGRGAEDLQIVDLGTGSGVIGLSLASELFPRVSEVWLVDASAAALEVARANAAGVGRAGAVVRVAEGDWFGALPGALRGQVDVVVANPPYIAEGDEEVSASVVEWEPHVALYSGADGLDAIRRIVADAPEWVCAGGWLVMEIGYKQGDAVAAAGQFQSFLQSYPDSRLAPNAWYWLGESYYATASYELALKSFGILLERFPDSGKTPDAMLKSAYCQLELKNTAQGKQQLERVIALYPEHPVAELARSRLRGLSLGQ